MEEEKIVIRGDGIYLRKITAEDTGNIVRWRNSDNVRKFFIDQRLFTNESHMYWLENYVMTGKADQLIICIAPADVPENAGADLKDYIPVGSVYIRDISREHRKAEYGIFIGEEAARGRGIGTKTAKLMVRYCFEQLHLHRIFLRVHADNTAAIKSYENAGFEKEAYLRDDVFVNGSYKDIVLMGILNPSERKEKE